MTYPNSSDVSSGQPTASAHYNNLRKDSLYLGNVAADSVNLGTFLQAFVLNMRIEYLATNRLRIPFDSQRPACVMIDGCMLVQAGNIDLPSSSFSGGNAIWYIFANRTAGVTSFTITVNTSAVPAAGQRLIGEVYWETTVLVPSTIFSYSDATDIFAPDYDSSWFSVAYSNTYTKAHGLGQTPRLVLLMWGDPGAVWATRYVVSGIVSSATTMSVLYMDPANVYARTGGSTTQGTLYCTNASSCGGSYRIFAWV